MGNCLALQEKVIKVMKTDGNILKYKAPMRVHQVLSEFSNHALSDTLTVSRHLRPDTEMLGGHIYYLLPLTLPSPKIGKKKVRFSDAVEEDGKITQGGGGVVRIKMVITKQELIDMLRKGGVAVNGEISQLHEKQNTNGVGKFDDEGSENNCKGWKPLLESIPEIE